MTAIRRRQNLSDDRAMAATGGGKIRSRRYHIASKPYAKSKQPQTGLISRVTDTVKSIVPSWLQKYFNNGDAPVEGEAAQTPVQNCQPPPNGSQEGPPNDERESPEPIPSNPEPSTSRASLNFQDYVLSRPPLSRSHLHFTPLDPSSSTLGASSSLFSQPSTSSAPGPFSTGFSLVKEIKDNLSQHEDDNISTTSGFSSRASDKDVPTSKTASLPQLWSPETDRTSSGSQPSQASLKKPAFNLSVFRTSSNSSLNSTLLNSSQLGDSPFYPGKTTYGGAAAVKNSRTRPGTPYQAPVRRQIKVKPAGAQPCGVTSATARRILQSLERMSSPLADVKRIPAAALSPRPLANDGVNMGVSHPHAKKKRMNSNLPPVQKLVVPAATVSAVSGNRSVSFRPTLTPVGMTRPLERTTRETPTRQSSQLPDGILDQPQSTMGSSVPVYPLSSTPAASSGGSGGGKMKRERTTTRTSLKCHQDDDVLEVPDLPAISLPISTAALPTFSFTSPLPPLANSTSSSPKVPALTPSREMLTNKGSPKAASPPFTFSSPIVKTSAASPPAFSPSDGFTFSAPVAKLGPSMSNGKLDTPIAAAVKPVTSKNTEEFDGPFKPAKTLKQGSVLDLLKSPGFASPVAQSSPSLDASTPLTSTQSSSAFKASSSSSLPASPAFSGLFKAPTGWSCDVCLVQNKPSDTKCVCCSARQPSASPKSMNSKQSPATSIGQESSSSVSTTTTTTVAATSFGTMFSKPAGIWDCDTCLVRNKPDAVKCVACETAKPGTGLKPSLTLSSAFSAVQSVCAPAAPVSTGLGDKFKKPEGAWECDVCMIQNKAEDTKCVACTNAKPGAAAGDASANSSTPVFGLGDKFKKPEGAWECDACWVQNKAADVQCVACQTAKPGAEVKPKDFGSIGGTSGSTNFGSSTSSSGGFKFGTSESIPETGSGGFKFGGSLSESTSSSGEFKFGTLFGNSSKEPPLKDNTASPGFKFGSSSEGFKFGTVSSGDKKSDLPATASQINLGAGDEIAIGTGSSITESTPFKGGFNFGLSKPEEKTSDATLTPSNSLTFSTSHSPQTKSDTEVSENVATPSDTTSTTKTTITNSVFGRLGESSLTTSAPQSASPFGSLQGSKEPAAPTFTFGKPEEKKDVAPPSVPSLFAFGAANKDAESVSTPVASGGFSFNRSGGTTEPSAPVFTFGKPADKSEATSSETQQPSFNFGQSATDSTGAAPKPTFFIQPSNPNTTTTSSSSSTPAPILFGGGISTSSSSTSVSAPSAAPSTFVFGQPAAASNDASPAKAFVFGQNQDSQPSVTSSAPAPAPSQPFIFGGSAINSTPAAPTFSFGAAAPPAASTSAPSTTPSPFIFNPAGMEPGAFGANPTPSFGSSFGSPFTATPSQTPAFGGKSNAVPVFGQQANSTPVFGATANSVPAGGGFPFGGAGAFGPTNNTSGVFTFGAGSAGSPAPSANASIAPQGGILGFNYSQAPAFNIGSTKSFPASPGGQPAIAGRKMKVAVRRRK
ncbi:nuclear pore complex protein Nup153 [Gouania willdenowi]|uniref:Nuclear pore complex protein Nup153 n=1 Tax=Gouania willdenowi TaxID=441366 RepID=A0A8C5DUW9_GOUWI|nr:nuclear pore complex protein Nup153 [Gouania willdenowi]